MSTSTRRSVRRAANDIAQATSATADVVVQSASDAVDADIARDELKSLVARTEAMAEQSKAFAKEKLPVLLRFPLLALLSLSAGSLGYSLVNEWSDGRASSLSRVLSWQEVTTLTVWRM